MHYLKANIKLSLVSYGHCPWFLSCHRREAVCNTHAGSKHSETASNWKTVSSLAVFTDMLVNWSLTTSYHWFECMDMPGHYRATEIIRNRVWVGTVRSFFICKTSPFVCFVRLELVGIMASPGHAFDTSFLVIPSGRCFVLCFFPVSTIHCIIVSDDFVTLLTFWLKRPQNVAGWIYNEKASA